MPNKLELMELQTKALFTHDSEFLIRSINDPDGKPAPRFFLGRTTEGNVLRFRYDLPQDISRKLADLIAQEPVSCYLKRDAALLKKINEVLGEHREVEKAYEGPAYRIPKGNPFPSDVIRITQDNVHLLKNSFDYMLTELPYWEPCFVKFEDGNAASICFSSRIATASHEAGVETLPVFRGKGYAAQAVAAWAQAIYEMGKLPTYSTSWENTASQAVARKLNCELYGVDLSVY